MLSFLGIGAQKAGTTWLYTQFRQHPELGFPLGKEAHFWNKPHNRRQIDDYLAAFSRDDRKEGEITPAYAMLPPPVIETIDRRSPGLRLIYIIRNPIDRAWSSALMALRRAEMEIDEASDQWFIDHFRSAGSLARGDYERCLRNWHQVAAAERLLVLHYEQIVTDPERFLSECFRHLGVSEIDPETVRSWGCGTRVFAGPRYPIRSTLRPVLAELYHPRIEALAVYLREDLSRWLVE